MPENPAFWAAIKLEQQLEKTESQLHQKDKEFASLYDELAESRKFGHVAQETIDALRRELAEAQKENEAMRRGRFTVSLDKRSDVLMSQLAEKDAEIA